MTQSLTRTFAGRASACALAVILACGSATFGLAQSPQTVAPPPALSPQLVRQLESIQRQALDEDYAYRQVAHLTNNIGPRLTGSAQAQAAVEYVAGEMRRLGLEVQLEKLSVPHWVRGEETAALTQYPGQAPGVPQKVVLTALGGSVATPPQGLNADVIVVNNFDELQALGRARVVGRIVLFNARFDDQMAKQGYGGDAYGQAVVYRGAGPSAAARLGAVAALVRSVGGASFRLPHTGATRYAQDAPHHPLYRLDERRERSGRWAHLRARTRGGHRSSFRGHRI